MGYSPFRVCTSVCLLSLKLLIWVQSAGATHRSMRSVKNLFTACRNTSSQLLLITEAFYLDHHLSYNRCDQNCNSRPSEPGPSLCKKNGSRSCHLRFSDEELNRIYHAYDAGVLENLSKTDVALRKKGSYNLFYRCLHVGQGSWAVDPCTLEGVPDRQGQTFLSIYLKPTAVRGNNGDIENQNVDRMPQRCLTECVLKPWSDYRTQSVFLLQGKASASDNFLMFQTVKGNERSVWTKISRLGFDNQIPLQVGVNEHRIRFHFKDLSAVTRLGLSFGRKLFSISCQPIQEDNMAVTTVEVPKDNTAKTLVITPICVGLAALIALIAVVALRCRKSKRVLVNGESSEVLTETGARTAGQGRPPLHRSQQSDEGTYIEFDDRSSVYRNTNRSTNMGTVYHTVPPAQTFPSPRQDAIHTGQAAARPIRRGMHLFNASDTSFSQQDLQYRSTFNSLGHPPTINSKQHYARPCIYANAPEDYQPYTSLATSSSDGLATSSSDGEYTEPYQYPESSMQTTPKVKEQHFLQL